MKTLDFSETIAASDLKVSRSSHLIEYMKVVSIEGQGHFLTLAPGHVQSQSCLILFTRLDITLLSGLKA